jgi:hypothetical protein
VVTSILTRNMFRPENKNDTNICTGKDEKELPRHHATLLDEIMEIVGAVDNQPIRKSI